MPDTTATLPTPAASATKAILGAAVRHVITAAGTAIVAHGVVDQTTVGAATGPIADEIVGALMVGGAAGWSVFRAWLAHTRFAAAIDALRARGG